MPTFTPLFFAVAAFAVFFVALAKAGFGGMVGALGMPLVAAVSDIPTAISILLPTYVAMDLIVAVLYRRAVDVRLLWPMALSGVIGVCVAGLAFSRIDAGVLAIFLGGMSLFLGLRFFSHRAAGQRDMAPTQDRNHRRWGRTLSLAGGSGFTSFFLMGEAPIQAYLLPFRLSPQVYVATLVWFFAIVNWAKIPIVLGMGLVTLDTLWISLLLLPIMPLGIAVGKYIATRIRKEPFYLIVHGLLVVLGGYLIASGVWQISAGW
ncbi:hypothetical protein SAMN04488003_10646 [Loktanella fryxellensis]|uniref:Probable membrane transporter protein n=1 Tax=Loktanella fryxellensis TaxID=245187 RepID=A0A1H8C379_9RHOB|nr:sulfite exporter TauE/SafE family protein [Loktanella fryxellensis]SEM89621.1 hypothetical protein SAMN04488003_10646 [Loktanella fryxellensis]